MSQFVSYAQNFEDVVLWRALKHVDRGFYIDVGAYSPTVDSVTQAFYERGWRGVNIEPEPDNWRQLEMSRPRDVNLNVALGDEVGEGRFYLVAGTGLSTLDPDEARQRALEGYEIRQATVRVETLSTVWQGHVAQGQEVHFLKIDVEGLERQVLMGNDWSLYRPWIVLIEATRPLTQETTHATWEDLLTGAGFDLVYVDGLNRFYLCRDHPEIAPAFAYPPNVFDQFVRATERSAIVRAEEMERRATEAERALSRILASRSWRMTQLLRSVKAAVSRAIGGRRRSGSPPR